MSLKNEQIRIQADRLENSYKNLKLLSEVGQRISSTLSVEKINELVYDGLSKFMDVGVFGIGTLNASENTLEFSGVMEKGHHLENFSYSLDDESRLASICHLEKKEIIINDFNQEFTKYVAQIPNTMKGDNASSIIYVPLLQGNKSLGVLTVQSFNKNAFSDAQIDVVRNIANYTKNALENAAAYEQIYRQSKILEEANEEIKSNNDFIAKQNEELLELNQEKNDLIGIVAHDLRNPLTSALSATELFKSEEGLSEDYQEYLFLISRSLNRMNDLIKRTLDVKVLESKRLDMNLKETDLSAILNHVIDGFKVQCEQKNIAIKSELIPVKVVTDTNFTHHIFENLISNALKFSNSNTKIEIKVKKGSASVDVEVIDEGPGFSEEDKQKLFGKFQKLSAKPTAGEESTGLGLSIVKKYADAMGVQVICESELGDGAKFIVRFSV